MKYLKYFQEESEYTGYKSSTSYVVPNVSYVVSTNLTFFDSGASSTTNIILYEDGYYPEVGQKLQELVNKYTTRSGLSDLGMDEIHILVEGTRGEYYLGSWGDDVSWRSVDAEDKNFLMSLQLPGLSTSYIEVILWKDSAVIGCTDDSTSHTGTIELYYDGTVRHPGIIS